MRRREYSKSILPITPDTTLELKGNEQPQSKPCGIEDFSLKSLCMRGNKSPAPQKRPKGRGIKPQKGYALNNNLDPYKNIL
jgi:hypothetical protein